MRHLTSSDLFRNLAGGTVALFLAIATLAASTGPALVNLPANSSIVRTA